MVEFTIEEIVEITGGRIKGRMLNNMWVSGISTDTRRIRAGCLFVALKGRNFDGHDFLNDAFKKGARAALVSRAQRLPNIGGIIIRVRDTMDALGELASKWRARFPVRVLCITGSNGKTTTKEMTFSVLSRRFNVLATEGNLNNLIGVPQMLFRLKDNHEIAVLEIGASRFGEIDRLAEITRPEVGLITNIGNAHLEFFKTLNGVLRAKMELASHLKDKTLIYNRDDRFLRDALRNFKGNLLSFGFHRECNIRCEKVLESGISRTRFRVGMDRGSHIYQIPVSGRHNIYNALGAIACGSFFGMTPAEIEAGLKEFSGIQGRWQLIRDRTGAIIIDDSYNANPSSMEAVLEELRTMRGVRRRIAVLGDMLELGKGAGRYHKNIGILLRNSGIEELITTGRFSRFIASGATAAGMPERNILITDDMNRIAQRLRGSMKRGDVILLKGSRAMQMERVIKLLEGV